MSFRELSVGLKRRLITFYIDSWRCSGGLYNEQVHNTLTKHLAAELRKLNTSILKLYLVYTKL